VPHHHQSCAMFVAHRYHVNNMSLLLNVDVINVQLHQVPTIYVPQNLKFFGVHNKLHTSTNNCPCTPKPRPHTLSPQISAPQITNLFSMSFQKKLKCSIWNTLKTSLSKVKMLQQTLWWKLQIYKLEMNYSWTRLHIRIRPYPQKKMSNLSRLHIKIVIEL